jgi:hypothetical protein
MPTSHPPVKRIIIGSGITGALEAYFAYLAAKKDGETIRVTILEKKATEIESTSSNIVPSLTPDEIVSVVPRGQELMEKLKLLFNLPGGIRVDDVEGVNDSAVADEFKQQVLAYSQRGEENHKLLTTALLSLGKMSMDLWQTFYDNADDELKAILIDANFNPCREPLDKDNRRLHDGYRIDLIYKRAKARAIAQGMQADYEKLGYTNCKILTPAEVQALDPFLTNFCDSHSEPDAQGEMQWQDDAVALWRPGGCLDTYIFVPKFYAYLKKIMGQFEHADGSLRDCFQIKLNRQVDKVVFAADELPLRIIGLKFFGNPVITPDLNQYQSQEYVFCPGEAVGTLRHLGFNEPSYLGFVGAVLKLEIPVPADKIAEYSSFNHCMEVHQEGIVLAWQARFHENKIVIGVGGTKAFYGDKLPHTDHLFARDRNLVQLNMMNDVLPQFLSLACGRDTRGAHLSERDLVMLQNAGIATRWVGTRAVSAEGFPTLGRLFHANQPVANARTTTHLGSGGVSFGPAAVQVSRAAQEEKANTDELTQTVLRYADSRRRW